MRENLWKNLPLFWHIFKLPLHFTCLQNFMIRKFKKTKCDLLQYLNKTSFFVATLNNIFDKNCEKYYNFSNKFLKYVYIFTLSSSFIISTFLQQKWQPFENVNNFLLISATLSNICEKTYEKTDHCLGIFSNFHFIFTRLQNFMIRKFKKKEMPFVSIS